MTGSGVVLKGGFFLNIAAFSDKKYSDFDLKIVTKMIHLETKYKILRF